MARRPERAFIVSEKWDALMLDWALILIVVLVATSAIVQTVRWWVTR